MTPRSIRLVNSYKHHVDFERRVKFTSVDVELEEWVSYIIDRIYA